MLKDKIQFHLMSNNKLNLWLHNNKDLHEKKSSLGRKWGSQAGEVSGLNVSYSCRCVSWVCHMIKKVIHMGQEEEQPWTCLASQSFTKPYEKHPLENKFLNWKISSWKYHRHTIQTVWDIVMPHTTCDPIHLLYFVMPALGLIQVIGRNAS